MTDQDNKNIDTIIKFVTRYMGYTDESLKIFIDRLKNPQIDEAYGKYLGPDLRARWEIDPSWVGQEGRDPGYEQFTSFFHIAQCRGCLETIAKDGYSTITQQEFNENLKTHKKNKIKIKTYLTEIFTKYPKMIKKNIDQMGPTQKRFLLESIPEIVKKMSNSEEPILTEEEIVIFILKSFEKIGEYKTTKKKDKVELVLSCNFADWLLSSTSEDWSSCFDLRGGYFWFSVPGLIGDANRSFLYTTKGIRKNFEEIDVERVINRTWILLDKEEKKNIVSFYPNRNAITNDHIHITTGDKSYIDASRGGRKGKYPIIPLFFESGVYSTTSQDASYMSKEKDKLILSIGNHGGTQYFLEDLTIAEENRGFSMNRINIDELKAGNKKASSIFLIKKCNDCGKTSSLIQIKNKYLCQTCFSTKYVKCDHCGEAFLKPSLKDGKKLIEKEGKQYCKSCYDNVFKVCDCCKETFNRGKMLVSGKKIYCKSCYDKSFETCVICGAAHPKEELGKIIIIETKKYCVNCTEKYFFKCSVCGKYHAQDNKKKLSNEIFCKECYKKNVHKCQGCKKTNLVKNLLIVHDAAKELRMRRCPNCIKSNYPKHVLCNKCGEYWEPERLLADGTCPKCNGLDY